MSPRRLAAAIASVRLMTFNFVKTLLTCAVTVVSLMKRSVPISLLLLRAQGVLAHQLRGSLTHRHSYARPALHRMRAECMSRRRAPFESHSAVLQAVHPSVSKLSRRLSRRGRFLRRCCRWYGQLRVPTRPSRGFL